MIQRQLPDGTPYQEVEPGDPPSPTHDADACGQCQFVNDGSSIFYTKVQEEMACIDIQKMLAIAARVRDPDDFIIELGRFTLPRWAGHAMWYLFQCPECMALCRDYAHGHRLYLKCSACGAPWHLTQDRFYEQSEMPKPPTQEEIEQLLKDRRRRLQR